MNNLYSNLVCTQTNKDVEVGAFKPEGKFWVPDEAAEAIYSTGFVNSEHVTVKIFEALLQGMLFKSSYTGIIIKDDQGTYHMAAVEDENFFETNNADCCPAIGSTYQVGDVSGEVIASKCVATESPGILDSLGFVLLGSAFGSVIGSGALAVPEGAKIVSDLMPTVNINGRMSFPVFEGGVAKTSLKGGLIGLAIGLVVTGGLTYYLYTSTPEHMSTEFFEDYFGLE